MKSAAFVLVSKEWGVPNIIGRLILVDLRVFIKWAGSTSYYLCSSLPCLRKIGL